MKITNIFVLVTAALMAGTANLRAQKPALPATPYLGGPVGLVEAPNGAIANKRLLDGIDEEAWFEPTIEQPVEGIWVVGGYDPLRAVVIPAVSLIHDHM